MVDRQVKESTPGGKKGASKVLLSLQGQSIKFDYDWCHNQIQVDKNQKAVRFPEDLNMKTALLNKALEIGKAYLFTFKLLKGQNFVLGVIKQKKESE